MITYNWVISQLECKAKEGDLTDVVYTIHWRYQANETDGDKSYFAEIYSTVTCPNPDPAHFTPYNELTQSQVEGWLNELLPVSDMQANLAAQIETQKNPPIVTPPLPWNQTTNI